MTSLLSGGSLALLFAWLVVGGLGVPLPEDAALLAAGGLVFHGVASPYLVVPIVAIGVLAGDIGLFLIARHLGPRAYERPLFRRLLPPARRQRVEAAYERHGGKLVFGARHVIGIRAATFALAGIHGMSLKRFVLWDALAAALSIPVVVTLGYLGARHLDRARHDLATLQHLIAALVVLGIVVLLIVLRVRRKRRPTVASEGTTVSI